MLGEERRRIRIISLTTAASMIEDYYSSGVGYDDTGLTERQLEIMHEENLKIAKKLRSQAAKLEIND